MVYWIAEDKKIVCFCSTMMGVEKSLITKEKTIALRYPSGIKQSPPGIKKLFPTANSVFLQEYLILSINFEQQGENKNICNKC